MQPTENAACQRAPIGLLAELTHRCPLQCPYCSNPLALEGARAELDTATWQDVLRQAARLGGRDTRIHDLAGAGSKEFRADR